MKINNIMRKVLAVLMVVFLGLGVFSLNIKTDAATSGSFTTDSTSWYGDGYTLTTSVKVSWSVASQSNNTTYINVTATVVSNLGSGFRRGWYTKELTVNGQTYTDTTYYNVGGGSVIYTKNNIAIPHNADGTKSFDMSFKVRVGQNNSWTCTGSGSFTLDPFKTVKYDLDGGTGTSTTQYTTGSVTTHPAPTKANSSASEVTVTFNPNGGSVSPTSTKVGGTISYTFEKWHVGSATGATSVGANSSFTPGGNVTLVANYTKTTTYNTIGTLPTPTRSGYRFDGWYTAATGGTAVSTSYRPSGNATIYAHWTQLFVFDLNGKINNGTNQGDISGYGTADVYINGTKVGNGVADFYNTYPPGTTYKVNNIKAANGYSYAGNAEYSGTINQNTEVLLRFNSNTYTVTYNNNGGSGGPGTQQFLYNTGAKYSTVKPTRTGYTFNNWKYDASHSFNPGDSIPSGWGSHTLTAQWTANTVTLTLNKGTGINTVSGGGNKQVDSSFTATATLLNGYHFVNWTDSNGNQRSTNNPYNGTMPTSNLTLTANGAANVYKVVFNKNATNATGTMSNQTITYNTNTNLTTNSFARTGYKFKGWNTAANGSGTSYSNGQSMKSVVVAHNGTLNLYAQWELNSFNLVLNPNGGKFSDNQTTNKTITNGLTYQASTNSNISSYTPTRTGYIFKGWMVDSKYQWDASGKAVNGNGYWIASGSNSIWNVTKGVTAVAQWEPIKYNIKFDLNASDATGTVGTNNEMLNLVYDQNITLPSASNLERVGYLFAGWNSNKTNATNGVVQFTDGQQTKNVGTTNGQTVTLYAVWKEPMVRGMFVYWSGTSEDGVALKLKDKASVINLAHTQNYNVILNANWLLYNLSGGVANGTVATLNANNDITLTTSITKNGSTFTNWSVKNGSTTSVAPNPITHEYFEQHPNAIYIANFRANNSGNSTGNSTSGKMMMSAMIRNTTKENTRTIYFDNEQIGEFLDYELEPIVSIKDEPVFIPAIELEGYCFEDEYGNQYDFGNWTIPERDFTFHIAEMKNKEDLISEQQELLKQEIEELELENVEVQLEPTVVENQEQEPEVVVEDEPSKEDEAIVDEQQQEEAPAVEEQPQKETVVEEQPIVEEPAVEEQTTEETTVENTAPEESAPEAVKEETTEEKDEENAKAVAALNAKALKLPVTAGLDEIIIRTTDPGWVKSGDTWVYHYTVNYPDDTYYLWEESVPGYYSANVGRDNPTSTVDRVATITNRNTETPKGSFDITKVINGELEDDDTSTAFTFNITLQNPTAGAITGTQGFGDVVFRNGVGSITLRGGQTAKIENLPVNTTWSITETPVSGWTLSNSTGATGKVEADVVKHAVFTNTKQPVPYGSFTVRKQLKDSTSTQAFDFIVKLSGLVPNRNYNLSNNTVYNSNSNGEATVRVSLRNNESVTFLKLPVNAKYTVAETANNFIASYAISNSEEVGANTQTNTSLTTQQQTVVQDVNTIVTFTNGPKPLVDFTVNKVWVDNNNVNRPTSVTVTLYQNDEIAGTATLNDGNGWTYTWKNLDKIDSTGKLYNYTVKEAVVNKYTESTVYNDYSATITNTKNEVPVNSFTLSKATVNGTAGDEFTFKVVLDNLEENQSYVINKSNGEVIEYTANNIGMAILENLKLQNGQTLTFVDVPIGTDVSVMEYANNYIASYTVTKGSTTLSNGANDNPNNALAITPFTVEAGDQVAVRYTNIKRLLIDVEVIKNWQNEQPGDRPASIQVQLLRDGAVYRTATLNANNNWRYTWEDLDKEKSFGIDYDYTINEVNVDGYTSSVVKTTHTQTLIQYTVTNTLNGPFPVGFVKLDNITKQGLAGATFNISGVTTTGRAVNETFTSSDIRTEISLYPGSYILQEVNAPAHYVTDPTPISVVVSATGDVTCAALNDDGDIEIVNEREEMMLMLGKIVSGNLGNKQNYFKFTLEMEGLLPGKTYDVNLDQALENITSTATPRNNPKNFTADAQGKATITLWLTHSQRVSVNLPYGTYYRVTEAEVPQYVTKISVSKPGSATSVTNGREYYDTLEGSTVIQYNNNLDIVVPTGVTTSTDGGTYISIISFILFGLCLFLYKKERELD